jgi:hypothetical protein
MRHFQCSKCKTLTETAEADPAKLTAAVLHCGRRMRELTAEQYAHEGQQRAWLEGGPMPDNAYADRVSRT